MDEVCRRWMWVRLLQIATLHVGPILMSHWLTCLVMRFDAAGSAVSSPSTTSSVPELLTQLVPRRPRCLRPSRDGYLRLIALRGAVKGGEVAAIVDCPVCGEQVDPEDAPASDTYDDQTYVFSSDACRDAFLADPGRYVGNTGS